MSDTYNYSYPFALCYE
jgi:hypothetical protein